MILDITAIRDYQNIATIQKLSFGLDMSKVILLLDDSQQVNSPAYISELISMGIYNFTRNIDAITYLRRITTIRKTKYFLKSRSN